MKLQRRTLAVVAAVAGLVCLLAAGIIVWRVERTLKASNLELVQSQEIGVDVRPVAQQPNPGFEGMKAPASFKSVLLFQGHTYLSGPAGLYAYGEDGALVHLWRTGMELPAVPLGQMVPGMVAGSKHQEILIATSGAGVLAFDGQTFRQIEGKSEESRMVTALLPLSSGRLLIGTAKMGLLVFNGKSLQRFHSTTNNLYVTALAGTEAELWVGTLNQGVIHWHGGQADRLGEEAGLPDQRVEQIALAEDRAYVGTPMGVGEFRDGKLVRVLAKGRYAHAVMVDGDALLVGQIEAGTIRIPLAGAENAPQNRRPIAAFSESGGMDAAKLSSSGSSRRANEDQETVEQFLAVRQTRYALVSDGLLRREPSGEWRRIAGGDSSELTDRNVSSLLVASDGRLWVGYFDRGLDRFPAAGGSATHIENEQVFCVNRIVEDPRNGTVAVATANGLVLFDRDGHQKQVLGRESGLIAQHVTDVALYGDGMALATPAGITFLDRSGAHSLYAFQGLVNNHVYSLSTNGDRLAAGTLGGISLLKAGVVQRNFTVATSGLKHNWITGLVAVADGWLVGTYGAGVMHMSSDGTVASTDATRPGVIVNPTALVTDGRIVLAGTLGQGLLVGDASGMRWKTVTAGLPALNVTALAIHNGVVYVGTENGLVQISEDKL